MILIKIILINIFRQISILIKAILINISDKHTNRHHQISPDAPGMWGPPPACETRAGRNHVWVGGSEWVSDDE